MRLKKSDSTNFYTLILNVGWSIERQFYLWKKHHLYKVKYIQKSLLKSSLQYILTDNLINIHSIKTYLDSSVYPHIWMNIKYDNTLKRWKGIHGHTGERVKKEGRKKGRTKGRKNERREERTDPPRETVGTISPYFVLLSFLRYFMTAYVRTCIYVRK